MCFLYQRHLLKSKSQATLYQESSLNWQTWENRDLSNVFPSEVWLTHSVFSIHLFMNTGASFIEWRPQLTQESWESDARARGMFSAACHAVSREVAWCSGGSSKSWLPGWSWALHPPDGDPVPVSWVRCSSCSPFPVEACLSLPRWSNHCRLSWN